MGREIEKIGHGITEARHVNYDNIASAGTTDVVNAQNLANADHTLAGQCDVPRNLVVTVVDTTGSIVAGDVDIFGKDANGDDVTENFDIAAGAGTYTGNVAFAYVERVTGSGITVLGGGGDETLSVGGGLKIGLPMAPSGNLLEVYKSCVDGANEVVGTVNKTYGTIVSTTAPNGTRDFDFWYLCQIQLGSF
jgi:hypothetical protein